MFFVVDIVVFVFHVVYCFPSFIDLPIVASIFHRGLFGIGRNIEHCSIFRAPISIALLISFGDCVSYFSFDIFLFFFVTNILQIISKCHLCCYVFCSFVYFMFPFSSNLLTLDTVAATITIHFTYDTIFQHTTKFLGRIA